GGGDDGVGGVVGTAVGEREGEAGEEGEEGKAGVRGGEVGEGGGEEKGEGGGRGVEAGGGEGVREGVRGGRKKGKGRKGKGRRGRRGRRGRARGWRHGWCGGWGSSGGGRGSCGGWGSSRGCEGDGSALHPQPLLLRLVRPSLSLPPTHASPCLVRAPLSLPRTCPPPSLSLKCVDLDSCLLLAHLAVLCLGLRSDYMAAAKRVLRYLCSTSGMGLVLGGRRPVVLTGHADTSWADDQASQRSSQGYTFSLASGSVSWRSTRSSSVLSSSCEAEIYAGVMAGQELRWLTYLLTDLGEPPRSPPVLYVDNKAMLALCREHRLEPRTKHIALRYFLARELQQRGQLRLAYVASEANTADIFTKALAPGDHQRFCTMLACFALLDWSCDLLFSPTLPMGVCQTYML
ncbi:unnamed protein product, partial [Closterium sp. NIES-53]